MTTRRAAGRSSNEEAFISAVLRLPSPPYSLLSSPSSPSSPSCSPPAKRVKRTRNLTENEDAILKSVHSGSLFTVEDHRVVGPEFTKIPRSSISHRTRYVTKALEDTINDILLSHGLSPVVSKHRHRIFLLADYGSSRGIVTLWIDLKQTVYTNAWKLAAESIYAVCQKENGYSDLSIELTHWKYARLKRLSCQLPANDPCAIQWPYIEPTIRRILVQEPDVTSFRLTQRGRISDLPADLFKPTILVKVNSSSDDDTWSILAQTIEECTRAYPAYSNCAVEIINTSVEPPTSVTAVHDVQRSQTSEPTTAPHLTGTQATTSSFYPGYSLYPGCSVGTTQRAGYRDTSGTLGCFLKLSFPDGTMKVCGLTNWHVGMALPKTIPRDWDEQTIGLIRPDELKLHRNGMQPSTISEWSIQAPSPMRWDKMRAWPQTLIDDHFKAQISNLETKYGLLKGFIEERNEQDAETTYGAKPYRQYMSLLDEIKEHEQHVQLLRDREAHSVTGRLFAGSGYRCTKFDTSRYPPEATKPWIFLHILDWALFAINDHRLISRARVPSWKLSKPGEPVLVGQVGGLEFPSVHDHRDLADISDNTETLHEVVFKLGQGSGFTCGLISPLKETLLHGWYNGKLYGSKHDNEYAFVSVIEAGSIDDAKNEDYQQQRFSTKGDSGAAIYNHDYEFVGLLFASSENEEDKATYYIPADVLVKDIKGTTGAVDVSIVTSRDMDDLQQEKERASS